MTKLNSTEISYLARVLAQEPFFLNDLYIPGLIARGYIATGDHTLLLTDPPQQRYTLTLDGRKALADLLSEDKKEEPFVFDRDLHLGILHRVFSGEIHSTYGDSDLHGLMKEGYIINVNVCGPEGSTHTVCLTRKGIDELIAWSESRKASYEETVKARLQKIAEIDDYISSLNREKEKLNPINRSV